ncbi:DUF1839 family protein [Lentzea aerocolonigenes]|uniref:DUF1839 family protein n=1 Tax=Lentzea aerocolonigenes TaxID=68170 RepID=UPI0009E0ADFC|nr:DUF1839 family protein [Lentzea aerocolonigenes]MCP2243367.1 protein of unknown function (DUF1839) [Lentzea aerocolonigenes]
MRPIVAIDPQRHVAHPLHNAERVWTETSCSIDVWIEVLHPLDLDPVAALASTLSADFLGDQWRLLKFPLDDLRQLYGLVVDEFSVWRPLLDHIADALDTGRLLTVEVDSWFLPDTAGRSYHRKHVKSTIIPNYINRTGRRMEYFHGTGYYELSSNDFDGLFPSYSRGGGLSLTPYVEIVSLEQIIRSDILPRAIHAAQAHLIRRPLMNPVEQLGNQLEKNQEKLRLRDARRFHGYAFATIRQCGATAELAGSFARWLSTHSDLYLEEAAVSFDKVAREARSLQFKLSRLTHGRPVDIQPTIAAMAGCWEAAVGEMTARLCSGSHPDDSVDRLPW